MQRRARDAHWVEDSGLHHVCKSVCARIIAYGLRQTAQLCRDCASVLTGIFRDLPHRCFQRVNDRQCAGLFISAQRGRAAFYRRNEPNQRRSTARHNALKLRRLRGMDGILQPQLSLPKLRLRPSARMNGRNAG